MQNGRYSSVIALISIGCELFQDPYRFRLLRTGARGRGIATCSPTDYSGLYVYKILVPAAVGSRYGFRDCKFEFLVRRNAPDTGSFEGVIYHVAEGVTTAAQMENSDSTKFGLQREEIKRDLLEPWTERFVEKSRKSRNTPFKFHCRRVLVKRKLPSRKFSFQPFILIYICPGEI